MALHLYGVVRAGVPAPGIDGVGEPPGAVRTIEHDDLAVLVSEIDDPGRLSETDAVRHLDVLTAVVAGNAVLPLRFGTTAPGEQSVREEVLAPAAPRLRDQLTRFAELVELRIDLAFDEETTLRAVLADRADIRDLAAPRAGSGWMEQQVRLGEAVADALTGWIGEQGRATVAPLAERAPHAVRLPGPETQTDRWAFLVPRNDLPEMDGIVSSIRADNPLVHIEYVGPLPVLDFRAEDLDAPATSAWGW